MNALLVDRFLAVVMPGCLVLFSKCAFEKHVSLKRYFIHLFLLTEVFFCAPSILNGALPKYVLYDAGIAFLLSTVSLIVYIVYRKSEKKAD